MHPAPRAADPPAAALQLLKEAEASRREGQRLQRQAARQLEQARRICERAGWDFVLVRKQRKDGVVDERHGPPERTPPQL